MWNTDTSGLPETRGASTAVTSSSANPPFLAVSICLRHLNLLWFLVVVLQKPEQEHTAASESSQVTAEEQAVCCQGHVLVRNGSSGVFVVSISLI